MTGVNEFDVVVAGAGIIGGSIAFELARRNLRVALIDRQEPGREASWAAAGMLSPAPDSPGAIALVPLARASLNLYPQFISDIEVAGIPGPGAQGGLNLRTGYRADGAMEVLFRGDAVREMSTLVALHHGLGLAAEPLSIEQAREMEPALSRDLRAAVLLPGEASVDSRALTEVVIAAAIAGGAVLVSGAAVVSLVTEGARCSGVNLSDGRKLLAGHVVLAAGCWTSQLEQVASYAPTRPVRGQMAALRHRGSTIRRVLRSDRGYIVPRDHQVPQKILVGATSEDAGYEKCVTSGGLEQIFAAVNELAPELARAEIIETWSGLRPGTPDQLPILGPTEIEGLIIATGHYRNGILLAPVTAKLIAEWICENRTSIDWEAFSPARFTEANSGGQSAGA